MSKLLVEWLDLWKVFDVVGIVWWFGGGWPGVRGPSLAGGTTQTKMMASWVGYVDPRDMIYWYTHPGENSHVEGPKLMKVCSRWCSSEYKWGLCQTPEIYLKKTWKRTSFRTGENSETKKPSPKCFDPCDDPSPINSWIDKTCRTDTTNSWVISRFNKITWKQKNTRTGGDSSCDLFIPDRWWSRFQPFKRSRELTIPKRSPAELPGTDTSKTEIISPSRQVRSQKYTSWNHHLYSLGMSSKTQDTQKYVFFSS